MLPSTSLSSASGRIGQNSFQNLIYPSLFIYLSLPSTNQSLLNVRHDRIWRKRKRKRREEEEEGEGDRLRGEVRKLRKRIRKKGMVKDMEEEEEEEDVGGEPCLSFIIYLSSTPFHPHPSSTSGRIG